MRKKFYTRSLFLHQHGCRFILKVNQYGRRDEMCKTICRCKVALIFDGDDINDKKTNSTQR